MAVDPALVNQGIGTLLLVHAMSTLALPIRLYTFQANAGARRFYEWHSFVPIEFTDGQANEEHCPDVLYELRAIRAEAMEPAHSSTVQCPGCGARFPELGGPTHDYMESSAGCWAAYGEVLAREYSNPSLLEIHRLSVDTYAVQHPGQPSRQSINSVGLHLVRLYLLLERGLPAEQANAAMLAISRHKQELTWLEPPTSRGTLTVASVLPHLAPEEHKSAVRAWARCALSAWSVHQPTIERWAEMA